MSGLIYLLIAATFFVILIVLNRKMKWVTTESYTPEDITLPFLACLMWPLSLIIFLLVMVFFGCTLLLPNKDKK